MEPDLVLEHQLCFALYSASRATQQAYRPRLTELGLTYTQYLVLLALWERDGSGVGELGERLHLDSGTLSPLLRRMEGNGLVDRRRQSADERVVTVHLTDRGWALRTEARDLQRCLSAELPLEPRELLALRDLALRLVGSSADAPGPADAPGTADGSNTATTAATVADSTHTATVHHLEESR